MYFWDVAGLQSGRTCTNQDVDEEDAAKERQSRQMLCSRCAGAGLGPGVRTGDRGNRTDSATFW